MNTSFPSLRIEGGLLSGEMIDKIAEASADIPGQKPVDFGLEPNRPLIDEIASAWNDARSYWALFQKSLERLKPDDPGTTLTRDRWMVPFFSLLGYNLQPQRKAAGIEGASYFISHRGGVHEQAPPIHITGFRQKLGERPESGVPRLAPHSLVQEYLNRSEELWGIVTNGNTLRILRDSRLIRRQAYIEFDLKEIIEGERFADFALLYRLIHATRLPKGSDDVDKCLLEQYYRTTVEQGGRVRDHLRDGVERALVRFGNGFLNHSKNSSFSNQISQNSVNPFEYYQQLLRLIYRFLFLMVSEERGLISDNELFRQHYSITRIRNLAGTSAAYNEFEDLWTSLRATFSLFTDQSVGALFQVPPLNGDLFDISRTESLNPLSLSNRELLHAVWDLSMYRENDSAPWRRINYAALDVEELGSVYESLLEFHPVFKHTEGKIKFEFLTGTERKSTGSYYTPPELVNELIQSTLVPIIKDRLKGGEKATEKEEKLLSISVCDPACGSGHFLLAAARKIGKELAKVRTDNDEPSPDQTRLAIRDVITHCIYGVDKNPLAVDLCKVALWLEGHTLRKPLTFLDHRIRCGDSLIGIFDLNVLIEGIPDEAYTTTIGEDNNLSKILKNQNKKERINKQLTIIYPDIHDLTLSRKQLNEISDDTPAQVRHKASIFKLIQKEGTTWCKDKTASNLWTSAFFIEIKSENQKIIPTTAIVRTYLAQGINGDVKQIEYARNLEEKYHFFHWPLEFPEIFERGGFDCILGNPPWDRLQFEEQEFFKNRDIEIYQESNQSKRRKLISDLKIKNNPLFLEWYKEKHYIEKSTNFLKKCGRFPLSAYDKFNLYAVFTELATKIKNRKGYIGIIVKGGLITDELCSNLFFTNLKEGKIQSVIEFENKKKIFPNVHPQERFALVTFFNEVNNTEYSFNNLSIEDSKKKERKFTMSLNDVKIFSPNNVSFPKFSNKEEFILSKKCYENGIPLVDLKKIPNWEFSIDRYINISDYSDEILTSDSLPKDELKIKSKDYAPIYEGKLISQYDHRFASYSISGKPEVHNIEDKSANVTINLFRYIPLKTALRKNPRLHSSSSFIAVRNITNRTNERGVIAAIIPAFITDYTLRIIQLNTKSLYKIILLSNLNSIVFDFLARQKIGGSNLSNYILEQTPIISPKKMGDKDFKFIIPRCFELLYTAWDVKAFADEVWLDSDNQMKDIIRNQHQDNHGTIIGNKNGSNPVLPSKMIEIGIPLSPFIWDENRRAIIRAELDAWYAKLYGLNREDLRYILDPNDLFGPEFPGETFRVLKDKDIRNYDEYRTRRLILEAWDKFQTES